MGCRFEKKLLCYLRKNLVCSLKRLKQCFAVLTQTLLREKDRYEKCQRKLNSFTLNGWNDCNIRIYPDKI